MQTIPFSHLAYMIFPLLLVAYFYFRWVGNKSEVVMATCRMSVQLIAIGYVLTSLFETQSLWLLGCLVAVMITVASMIVKRNLHQARKYYFLAIFGAIALSGTLHLALVIFGVLSLENPFDARYVIPLAGMIYANAMNAISLCAERFEKERAHHAFIEARAIAFKASMIPQINSFLAVGFVSLPGMMTGQILSGIDPLIAVRYQIVVMAMILCSGAMSNILYLSYLRLFERYDA